MRRTLTRNPQSKAGCARLPIKTDIVSICVITFKSDARKLPLLLAPGSATIDQKNSTKSNKTNNNNGEVNRNEDNAGDCKNAKKKNGPGGPLLHQAEVSSSQLDFFRMLDEKIENGPDYDETSDGTVKAERISELLRRWETASITWSSVTDLTSPSMGNFTLTSAPVLGIGSETRHAAILSARDREGMRNIIGGRPESAPVYIANRLDGLPSTIPPSPQLSRHVLESISQSPTQSAKVEPVKSPPVNHRASFSAEEGIEEVKLYREQYLQRTGIIYQNNNNNNNNNHNILRNNQINLTPTRKRLNAAQIT
ncbi:hypothetical protein KQX54_002068 [Cotesia glomerata]|uniref:Uncharacterized protein n=1 Tax=Cotesia glomerata TaxID=32391 RepID=A0AAV7IU36_COTGL|nr:hypothetical protein KQX54_002068 [Cotesia glomerata]